MVVLKKRAVKKEQAKNKGKNVFKEEDDLDIFDDMDDMEDDEIGDSEEETRIQKNPRNKTPKGRQSLSEKKSSFQIPGNNSSAKTPNKSNLIVSKKQPTPGSIGKTAVQQFKRLKRKNNQSKQDDDVSEGEEETRIKKTPQNKTLKGRLSLNEKKESAQIPGKNTPAKTYNKANSLPAKKQPTPGNKGKTGMNSKKSQPKQDYDNKDDDDLDFLLGEESNDDEKEDDDDDHREKVEEEEESSAKLSVQTKLSKEREKKIKSLEKKLALKAAQRKKKVRKLFKNVWHDELVRRNKFNAKMLYVGKLPKVISVREMKALSPDIVDCIAHESHFDQGASSRFAFLRFASEEKAEENYKILQDKKLFNKPLKVDFVGEKSKHKLTAAIVAANQHYDRMGLTVYGLPLDVTMDMVANFFPKAFQITFNFSRFYRVAYVNFRTSKAATEAFKASRKIEIGGQEVTVLHTIEKKTVSKHQYQRPQGGNKRKFGGNKNGGEKPAKRMNVKSTEDN